MARSLARPVLFDASLPQPDLPAHLIRVLHRVWPALAAWISALVFAHIVRHRPNDPLVQLDRFYNPTPLIAACADYHHADGPGAPPTYTVAHLVRAEIIRAVVGGLSDHELERLLHTDIIARWYLGRGVFESVPDHTTVSRFHAWMSEHASDAWFRDVLTFLDRVDPEDPRTTPQLVDTFAMASAAAPQGPAVVLMRLMAQVIATCREQAPTSVVGAIPDDLDEAQLRTAREAQNREKGERQRIYTVQEARALIAALTPHLDALEPALRAELTAQFARIEQVIADEFTTAADGTIVPRGKQKGTYRIASAVDTDATFRKHGGRDSPAILGYNAAVSVTTTRIRAAVLATGGVNDGPLAAPLIVQQREAGQVLPEYLVGDMAYREGKTRADVFAASNEQTTLVAKLVIKRQDEESRFSLGDFQVIRDAEGNLLRCRCPNGVVTTKFYRAKDRADGKDARFTAKDCAGCPLWDRCREEGANPKGHRQVFISDYHHHVRAADVFNATELGQQLLRGRCMAEPMIAFLVRYDGCRRARRMGQAAAEFQLKQACAARNLKLWLARVARGQAPPPPRLGGR